MIPRPKRLPRLWCALQGLLPWEAGASVPRSVGRGWARTEAAPAFSPGLTDVGPDAGSGPGAGISAGKVESSRGSER